VAAVDGRAIGDAALAEKRFSDDRFARALDRLLGRIAPIVPR
jgi:hypothetical protein